MTLDEPIKDQESDQPKKRRRFSKSILSLWIVVVVLAGGLGYMIWVNHSLKKSDTQTKIAEEANRRLVGEISNIFLVPTDETPTIATIIDVESLKKANANFYKNAQNNDKLIVYSNQALIYRESDKKIINVAPIVLSPDKNAGLKRNSENTGNDKTAGDTSQ